MIIIFLISTLLIAGVLAKDGIDITLDWQAMIPMADDILTLIGLLLAVSAYILVIFIRYQRLLSTPKKKSCKPVIARNPATRVEKVKVFVTTTAVIHNLNQ
jgi:hypothetical protein